MNGIHFVNEVIRPGGELVFKVSAAATDDDVLLVSYSGSVIHCFLENFPFRLSGCPKKFG